MRDLLFLLALLFLFACGTPEAGHRQTGTDSSHADTTAVKSWLDKLPAVSCSHAYLDVNENADPGPFVILKPFQLFAGKLPGKRDFVPVLVKYQISEGDTTRMLLVTFTPDGKEIARQEVGLQHPASEESPRWIHRWPMLLNDTVVEVREERWARSLGDEAKVQYFTLTAAGQIHALPLERTSFETYAARFPDLQAPFAAGRPEITTLKRVSRFSPWYSYRWVIGYDQLDMYHYGKIQLPGKPLLLLYAYGPTSYDDGEKLDTTLQLITCKTDGTAIDQLPLYTTITGEGNVQRSRNAVVRQDGSVMLEESSSNVADMTLWELGSTVSRLKAYHIGAGGKFEAEIHGVTYTVPGFSDAAIQEVFQSNKDNFAEKEDLQLREELFSLRDRSPLGFSVKAAFYHWEGAQVAELLTFNEKDQIVDRYVLFNPRGVRLPDAPKGTLDQQRVSDWKGPVTLHLGSTTLQITREGKFVRS
ncbi:hypothetical protein SAMN04488128_10661 [Chitinophaga eiseniae]|uniref:Lipoprotein n=1 Tax=Chitinophaga eiseniae TaxID=634771 RepID=A0A1T4TR84_9BACT|nr:hypothetical protein [Chitinophaga eiseniae]SKA42947.1 hypothetical protein SAMN04488128_10661 [Chitinophaga eiseniae]